jgi:hypothetical protein
LLSIAGRNLVVPLTPDPDLPVLLERGELMHGYVQLVRMQRSRCHPNAAKLWVRTPRKISAIGTGYALSDDGLWRQHSWGVKSDGTLVETTIGRVQYFGLQLRGAEADMFAALNNPA